MSTGGEIFSFLFSLLLLLLLLMFLHLLAQWKESSSSESTGNNEQLEDVFRAIAFSFFFQRIKIGQQITIRLETGEENLPNLLSFVLLAFLRRHERRRKTRFISGSAEC